ncbi:DUF1772 domain-containing protein [Kitasatospora sp. NBC_00240]|uniref:anthrone oxygenase family protein n=1 Tax=Kitasatospora sp. NBC_00240 TaxID=2903567 RepID=UPI002256A5F2|nr:anthrone oxygenase family protein [Kitasatospora sp. NBC_00240]MCX5213255.1 DUF1772 domain-containing protein [Kitasatospora sp. NBC_00240]
MPVLRTASLLAATVTMGLTAGLFYAYACSVMIALRGVDDRTFVDVMQRINTSILNGWFGIGFGGAILLTGITAALHRQGGARSVLPWIVAAIVLYGVMFVVTSAVNVPLNNQLAAAGAPDGIADLAGLRAHFEGTWVRWNIVRAIASTGALGCLAWALVLEGRIR